MADLNARIKPKKSSTTGEVPQAADLEVAEIAVNTADGKLFVKHTDNSIKEISGSGGGAVSSVNGEVGAVELDLSDLNDVAGGGDPDFANVQLLLLGEGADAGTTVTDSSSNAFSPLVNSGVTTSTAQFKYGSSSLRMTGGRIAYSDNAAFTLGSADFTIETWIRTDSIATGFTIGSHRDAAGVDEAWGLWWDQPSGNLKFQYSLDGSNSQPAISRAWSPSVDTWYHVALVRSGSDLLMFVDGTQLGSTAAITGSIHDSSRPLTVGALELSSGYIYELTGYMDNFRLTVGVARYTADFTPGDAIVGAGSVPTDGQVLTWVDANSQWEPATPSGGATTIDELTDVDTSTAAPTDGQVLTWVDTSSQWEPVTPGGATGVSPGFTVPDQATNTLMLDISQYSGSSVVSVDSNASTWNLVNSGAFVTSWAKFPGGAMDFTSNNGYLVPASGTTLNETFAGDVTATCWINKTGSTYGPIFDIRSTNSTNLIHVWCNADGTFTGKIGEDADGAATTAAIADGEHHVALVRSGQIITLYIDGTSAASYDAGQVRSVTPDNGTQKSFGAYAASPNSFSFTGQIADIVINNGTAIWTSDFTPPDNNVAYVQSTGSLTLPSGSIGDLAYNTADGEYYNATSASTWDRIASYPSTASPTDGQVLTWVDANNQWEPATPSGGGAVSSVNGETGVVSLGVQEMDDYSVENAYTLTGPGDTDPQVSGEWYLSNTGPVAPYFAYLTADPIHTWLNSLPIGSPIKFITENGDVHTTTTSSTPQINTGTSSYIRIANTWPQAFVDAEVADESIVVKDANPGDNHVLTWIDANSQWEPRAPLTASETRAFLGIGEYIDDAAAGTGGVASGALYYNTTSSDYRIKS